ncbi:hypothetical protein BDN67DRAFT_1069368, partial [Paxillus ammoniavirescens]
MGPLHEKLKGHTTHLIGRPELLLVDSSDSHQAASFDGQPWDDFPAVQIILAMRQEGRLPNLRDLLVVFLRDALETWVRFMEEFAPGGLIATSAAAERELATMPTTNDINEGMQPSMTTGHFSDHTAFSRNGTQEFMDSMFTDEDHRHIRREVRHIDGSEIEKHRRED